MEPRMTLDPIHQFNIDNLFKIGQIGNQVIYATGDPGNASATRNVWIGTL